MDKKLENEIRAIVQDEFEKLMEERKLEKQRRKERQANFNWSLREGPLSKFIGREE